MTDGGGTRVINHGLPATKKAKLWNTWTSLHTNPLARSPEQVKLDWKLRKNLFEKQENLSKFGFRASRWKN
jgi:hypothetical protein